MHRIEIKTKDGRTVYVGTMSSFNMAVTLWADIYKNGYHQNESIYSKDIEAIHITTYLGSKP